MDNEKDIINTGEQIEVETKINDIERPEKPKRKRGRPKKEKVIEDKKINDVDIKIPLAVILMSMTSGKGKWEMSEGEAMAIETGFNQWLELRLPYLEKFYPEIILITPIMAYLIPRIIATKK